MPQTTISAEKDALYSIYNLQVIITLHGDAKPYTKKHKLPSVCCHPVLEDEAPSSG